MTRPGRLPRIPRPIECGHRAVIGTHTLRAAWYAHQTDTHDGARDPGCTTCLRYDVSLIVATTRENRERTRQETTA